LIQSGVNFQYCLLDSGKVTVRVVLLPSTQSSGDWTGFWRDRAKDRSLRLAQHLFTPVWERSPCH